jgi:plastocyanin
MDKLADQLMSKLVDRLAQHLGNLDVDDTTLGKPGAKTLGTMGIPQTKVLAPTNMMMGCPVARTTAANAVVKLGSDSGGLVFVPDTVTVKSGEAVTFTNNAGFPHNIVFDEDNVPDGVNAESLSREDYLNAPGETYEVKFDKAGTYGYYCEPHRGAGMQGKIVVQ